MCFRTSKHPDSSRDVNSRAEKLTVVKFFLSWADMGKREFWKSGAAVRRFTDLGEVNRKRRKGPGASRRGAETPQGPRREAICQMMIVAV